MYRLRKITNKSGSTVIQVVQYLEHQAKIAKHIGSSKDGSEFERIRFIPSHSYFVRINSPFAIGDMVL